MNRTIQNLLGGLAGSIALNIIHQSLAKTVKGAPRIDLVGEEALVETASALGINSPKGQQLFNATLAADVTSNALYYSTAGLGSDTSIVYRGAALGLLAGIGAVTVTGKVGLDDTPVTKTLTTKFMTVGYYLLGGIVAGIIIKTLRGRQREVIE